MPTDCAILESSREIPRADPPKIRVLCRVINVTSKAGQAVWRAYSSTLGADANSAIEAANNPHIERMDKPEVVRYGENNALTGTAKGIPCCPADIVWCWRPRLDESRLRWHGGHIIEILDAATPSDAVCEVVKSVCEGMADSTTVLAITATSFRIEDWERTLIIPLDGRDLDGHADRMPPQLTITIWFTK